MEDEYACTRVSLPAHCGTARLTLQIDMGLGDSVWPPPKACTYPALLDFPSPTILAYPPEAVIAEKLEAIVVLLGSSGVTDRLRRRRGRERARRDAAGAPSTRRA